MTIDVNWAEVSAVADATRELTENTVARINRALAECDAAAAANAATQSAAALAGCAQGWAGELADLTRRLMIAADNLDDSALTMEQAERQNTRAANALRGLLE